MCMHSTTAETVSAFGKAGVRFGLLKAAVVTVHSTERQKSWGLTVLVGPDHSAAAPQLFWKQPLTRAAPTSPKCRSPLVDRVLFTSAR